MGWNYHFLSVSYVSVMLPLIMIPLIWLQTKSHPSKHSHDQWQRWVNLSFYLLGATLVYNDGSNQNKWWWFLLIIKTKFKLPLYNFNCIGYLSEILVIILITRRTQRRMIQAITCTYRKMLVVPMFL